LNQESLNIIPQDPFMGQMMFPNYNPYNPYGGYQQPYMNCKKLKIKSFLIKDNIIPPMVKQEGGEAGKNTNPEQQPPHIMVKLNNHILKLIKGAQGYSMNNYHQYPGMMPQYPPYGGYQPYPNQYPNQVNQQFYQENFQANSNLIPNEVVNNQNSVDNDKSKEGN